jgi:epoxyqueuosine reductase
MSSYEKRDLSKLIKEYAYSIGFDLCGIAPCRPLKEHEQFLKKWTGAGMNAGMDYLIDNPERRTNPGLLFEGARSIIITGLNYSTTCKQGGDGIPVISRYAYGKDYHVVVKEKLHLLLEYIVSIKPSIKGQSYVDSGPVLEKAWGREAGLGWIGRHSILINKEFGSFIFLGELILNIELQYDTPYGEDNCTGCRLCMEACPTNAINEDRTIDARKCISWLTVENKNAIPEEFKGKMRDRIFGCDICQDVCPWNKNTKPHNNPELALSPELIKMTREEWLSLSIDKYLELFFQSSVGRIKYERLVRNIEIVLSDKS